MASINFPDEVITRVRRLLDDRNCPREIGRLAGDVLDLTALLETWPVPRSLNLDEDLQRQVFRLCRISGGYLCEGRQCMAPVGADSEWGCEICRMAN